MTVARAAGSDLGARGPKAIHSALVVLEEVARIGPGATAHEVSDNLRMPRATCYRLLNLLVQDEYLVRLPDLSGFALGARVSLLAGLAAPTRPPQAARSVIDDLRGRIRGGVHLVRYRESTLHVIDIDPDFPLSDPARIARYIDASAMGRLLLLELFDRDAVPATSIERDPAAIRAIVTETRDTGFARQVGQLTPGFGCLALPIRDTAGSLVAGICVSVPEPRVREPGDMLDTLRTTARELAPLLA